MKTRVPFSESYVRLVGTAVYQFSYYEWQIIYIVDELAPPTPTAPWTRRSSVLPSIATSGSSARASCSISWSFVAVSIIFR